MARARRATTVELAPQAAYELWADAHRWREFVDGFARIDHVDEAWPAPGSRLVWRSVPTGRGTVSETVLTAVPGERFATEVDEEQLTGTQTAEFAPADGGGTAVALELDYRLRARGPLTWLTDVLFIRRAEGDALARTLERFAAEAAEQAAL